MSDLLDSYLAAVSAQLPRGTPADVVAELRDVLLCKLERRMAELANKETADILEAFGRPRAVADRYRVHREPIGLQAYCSYAMTLQWVLGGLGEERDGHALQDALAAEGVVVDECALFPMLRRLEALGLLTGALREQGGRLRRLYRLSAAGASALAQLTDAWRRLERGGHCILEEKP
jgi:hypothetical protein